MRICLAHPTFWPEVRRGSERLIHDLATELSARGHEVTVLTSHRGPRSREVGSYATIRAPRPRALPPLRHYEDHLDSVPAMLRELRRLRPDLIHSFHNGWNWGVARAAPLIGGPPLVATLHGIPTRAWLVGRRRRAEMLRRTLSAASAVTVLSEAAAERFERYMFVRPRVLGGGVDLDRFGFDPGRRADRPTLVSAASLGDPRKRADLIFEAFARVRREIPGARLLAATTADPHMSPLATELPEGAEAVEIHGDGDLVALYGSGWGSVLAADEEAFGLVLLESMACGTPVIAPDAGGIPGLVGGERGRSFTPGDPGELSEAIADLLAEPPSTETVETCLEAARAWAWSRVGDRYENLYRELIDG